MEFKTKMIEVTLRRTIKKNGETKEITKNVIIPQMCEYEGKKWMYNKDAGVYICGNRYLRVEAYLRAENTNAIEL